MFCRKCGKEIKDNAAFCPYCGKEVTHRAKEGAGAGTAQRAAGAGAGAAGSATPPATVPKKRKKWILPVTALAAVAVVAVVVTAFVLMLKPSRKRVLTAYKEFYEEFYDDNCGGLADASAEAFDCTGKILMGPDGKLMMAIVDVTYAPREGEEDDEYSDEATVQSGEWSRNLYLYSYEWGKVKEKAKLRNLSIYGEYANFTVLNGNLYFSYLDPDRWETNYIFDEKEGKFEKVKWKLKEGVKDTGDNPSSDYEDKQGVSSRSLGYQSGLSLGGKLYDSYNLVNSAAMISGNDFEDIIDSLIENNKKSKKPVDFQIEYGKIVQDLNLWEYMEALGVVEGFAPEYPVAAVTETDDAYYVVRTSGNAGLVKVKNYDLTDASSVLKEANGHKVTRIENNCYAFIDGWYNEEKPDKGCFDLTTADIPDNITYIGSYAFEYCTGLKEVTIPESVTEIGSCAFENCTALKQMVVPGSVVKLGKYAFSECSALEKVEIPAGVREIGSDIFYSETSDFCPVILFCGKGSAALEYAEENSLFHIVGTIADADKKTVAKLQKQIKWKKAYIDYIDTDKLFKTAMYYDDDDDYSFDEWAADYYYEGYDGPYSLCDMNQDGIPEVVFRLDQNNTDSTVLSYNEKKGIVVESKCESMGWLSCNGTELMGSFDVGSGMYAMSVYSLKTNGKLEETHTLGMENGENWDGDFVDDWIYSIDGKEVSEEKYDQFCSGFDELDYLDYDSLIEEIKSYGNE